MAAAVLISFVIFMVLLEATMQIFTRVAVYYDVEMSRYAAEVKRESDNPKIGHVHRSNVDVELMGVRVRINSDGLRDQEYSVQKSKAYRIAVLGDSLTFGWGVEKEDTFETLLEQRLSDRRSVEMINFGTGNYNTEQQVNLFLEKGLKYSPDKVVVFFYINDAEVTPKRSDWSSLATSRSLTFFWSRFRSLTSRTSSSETFDSFYRNLYREDQPGFIAMRIAFLELEKICDSRSIALQVVLLPELHNLMEYPFTKEYRMVYSFLERNGIDVLDLTPAFLGTENARALWVAPDDAHPNDIAHGMIADHSREFVAKGIF